MYLRNPLNVSLSFCRFIRLYQSAPVTVRFESSIQLHSRLTTVVSITFEPSFSLSISSFSIAIQSSTTHHEALNPPPPSLLPRHPHPSPNPSHRLRRPRKHLPHLPQRQSILLFRPTRQLRRLLQRTRKRLPRCPQRQSGILFRPARRLRPRLRRWQQRQQYNNHAYFSTPGPDPNPNPNSDFILPGSRKRMPDGPEREPGVLLRAAR